MAERRADRGRHRLRRRQPGQHPHRRRRVLRLRGHLQHRGGHREHARVARGHHGDPAAPRRPGRARARPARPRPGCRSGAGAGAGSAARGRGRGRSRPGRRPPPAPPRPPASVQSRPAGPRPTTATSPTLRPACDAPVGGAAATALGSSASEKYGTDAGSTSASAAVRCRSVVARSTYHASSSRPASATRVAHGRERAAQLEHRRGVGVGQPLGQLLARQRAGQHGEHLVALDQRPAERRRRRAHRGHAGHDLGRVAVGQPLVHVHVGAVEERVALGEHAPRRARRRGARPAGAAASA